MPAVRFWFALGEAVVGQVQVGSFHVQFFFASAATWSMDVWRSVDALQAWRHGGMELWRRAVGVATWRYRGLEVWRCAVGVATSRHGGKKL